MKTLTTPYRLFEDDDFEGQLLKKLIWVSVFAHIFFAFFHGCSVFTTSEPPEWVIEAEFLDAPPEPQTKPDSLKNTKQAEELAVAQETLPQLTKEIIPMKEDKADTLPEPAAKPEEKKQVEEIKPKKEEEVEKALTRTEEHLKKVALDRLLKEKARLEKKLAKEDVSPLSETLLKRKEELKKLANYGFNLSGSDSGYSAVLKKRVSQYYSLPDIYNYRNSGLRASVEVVLNHTGQIERMNLKDSSHDDVFDSLALKTIERSSPFPSPPQDWVGQPILFPFEPGRSD
ncbi:MAG: TonB family protein [Oligoflexales bacterium]|nr:TonB family protein [Oligoflexales bacterium]